MTPATVTKVVVQVLCVLALVTCTVYSQDSVEGIEEFTQGRTTCRQLLLDGPLFNRDPTTGAWPFLTDDSVAANTLRSFGINITAYKETQTTAGTTLRSPRKVVVFPTEVRLGGPTGEDPDLGTPNELCGWVPDTVDSRCFADISGNPLAPLMAYEATSSVPYVNCSDPEVDCPGFGCGGARWKTVNINGPGTGVCVPELTETEVFLPNGTLATLRCPQANPDHACVPQGNVMVISEFADGEDPTDPDDDSRGGVIQFDFDFEVFVVSIGILDMEAIDGVISTINDAPGVIRAFDESGTLVGEPFELNAPGNNGFQNDVIATNGVSSMTVTFKGSGSVNDVVWCFSQGEFSATTSWVQKCEWDITRTVDPNYVERFVGQDVGGDDEPVYNVTVTRDCEQPELGTYSIDAAAVTGSPSTNAPIVLRNVTVTADPDPLITGNFRTNVIPSCECGKNEEPENFVPCTPSEASPVTIRPTEEDGTCAGAGIFCEIRCTANFEVPDSQTEAVKFNFIAATGSPVGTFSITEAVSFGAPDSYVDRTAEISDSDNGFPNEIVDADVTFRSIPGESCPADAGPGTFSHSGTSYVTPQDTFTPVGSATAGYTALCVLPTIAVTAETSFAVMYDWTIEKSGSTAHPGNVDPASAPRTTEVVLNPELDDPPTPAETATVLYDIVVTATPTEKDFTVTGTVTLDNPHTTDDAVFEGEPTVTIGATPATVTCPDVDPVQAGAAGSAPFTCTYTATTQTRPAGDVAVVATVAFNGFPIVSSTTFASFGDVTDNVGRPTATVTDQFESDPVRDLGQVAVDQGVIEEQTFDVELGFPMDFDALACDEEDMGENTGSYSCTATVTADEDGATDDSSWGVIVRTPCENGCPCEYKEFDNAAGDADILGDWCHSASGPSTGACLCWT